MKRRPKISNPRRNVAKALNQMTVGFRNRVFLAERRIKTA
jgi:hypothetical protein